MTKKRKYKYNSYAKLAEGQTEGTHYKISSNPRKTNTLIIAPHGGKIELGTSEIATAIAGNEFSLYLLEGLMKENNLHLLHISSHKFDEPDALELCKTHRFALGIHGRKNHAKINGICGEDRHTIFLGGLNNALIAALECELEKAGYETLKEGHEFPATHKLNICNRCTSGKGAQLEIPKALRTSLRENPDELDKFSSVIRGAISTIS